MFQLNLGNRQLKQRVTNMIPRLRAIALSWGCSIDVCDEIVQEAVTTAIEKIGQLRHQEALESWVIRILTNCHNLHLRQNRKLTELDNLELVDEVTPLHELDSSRAIEAVRSAIARLSDDHRKVLTLVDMEGLSYMEVAQILDLRVGTVMSRLCRARAQLRKMLKELLQMEPSEQDKHLELRRVK